MSKWGTCNKVMESPFGMPTGRQTSFPSSLTNHNYIISSFHTSEPFWNWFLRCFYRYGSKSPWLQFLSVKGQFGKMPTRPQTFFLQMMKIWSSCCLDVIIKNLRWDASRSDLFIETSLGFWTSNKLLLLPLTPLTLILLILLVQLN